MVPVSVTAVIAASVVAVPIITMPIIAMPIKAPAVISRSVISVVPRPGADEDAAYEVFRPVVSIRSASIRVVIVIAV
jgi:hypothetical protein